MAINTSAFLFLSLTMSVTSESASHFTLKTAYSRPDLLSDGREMKLAKLPLPNSFQTLEKGILLGICSCLPNKHSHAGSQKKA